MEDDEDDDIADYLSSSSPNEQDFYDICSEKEINEGNIDDLHSLSGNDQDFYDNLSEKENDSETFFTSDEDE